MLRSAIVGGGLRAGWDRVEGSRAATFGGRLRALREAAGLTQEELAERAGLSARGISALERGDRRRPYLHTIRALADALDLAPAERATLLAAGREDITIAPSAQTEQPTDPAASIGDADDAVWSAPDLLLRTKLLAPPPRPDIVHRPRLVARLDTGLRGKLTLLAAPAGFGKSTLLASWRATPAGREMPLAWVALDAADNDPVRFWRYLGSALDTLHCGIADGALALLRSPQPPLETALTALLNGLATLSHDAVLVLDDYHAIASVAIHRGLAFLLDHLPPRMHLLLASRADPPLPLARLRARGELVEIRADDLRFTTEEAATFLTDLRGLALLQADVALLAGRTEGWIAGLHLAALALRDRADLHDAIAAFAGSNRYVMDYLAEEVLAAQPEAVQSFLHWTAILERLSAPLCAAVTGESAEECQAMLEALDRGNLFLAPLDDERRWYRYHQLFGEVLRQRLRQVEPGLAPLLHRRAAASFEAQGMIAEAVRHALAGQAWDDAARLAERHAFALTSRGEVATVLGWFDAFPDSVVRARPMLAIRHAATLMYTRQLAAAESRLADAERASDTDAIADKRPTVQGWVATIRGDIARIAGDLDRCVALSRRALELLPDAEVIARAAAELNAARAYLISGDVSPATERRAESAVAAARASGNLHAILTSLNNLAWIRFLQGRLKSATETYAQAAAAVPGEPGALVNGAAYHLGLGASHYERDELDAAGDLLARGLALARGTLTVDARIIARGCATWARLLQARGDSAGALAALDDLAALGRERGFAPYPLALLAAARAGAVLAGGDVDAATRWAAECGLDLTDPGGFDDEYAYLTLIRVRVAQTLQASVAPSGGDSLAQAAGLLDRLLDMAEAGERQSSAIAILAVRALVERARGDEPAALAALATALHLAAPERFVRVFLDEGAPMAALLAALLTGRRGTAAAPLAPVTRAFAERLLGKLAPVGGAVPGDKVAPTTPVGALPEALTTREHEVLRLLAEGLTNAEIAERLFIGRGTVKTHVNRLLGKLGAGNRTQAIARARALHLLPG